MLRVRSVFSVMAIAAACVAAIPACALAARAPRGPRSWFVAPAGNDGGTGAIGSPLRSLGSAIGRLAPGDTLYLRAGTHLGAVDVAVSGTAAQRIVIRAYPGETALIDAGIAELETPRRGAWELVDAALDEYRSRQTVSGDRVIAYLTDLSGYVNERVVLVPYKSAAAFRATTDQYNATAFYVGPGTFVDTDRRVHIRLTKTADLRAAEARYGAVLPERADPNDHAMRVCAAPRALRVTGAYLVFLGITVEPAKTTIELGAGCHHVRFEDMTVWIGDRGIGTAAPDVHDVAISRSRVYGDAPWWIFWSDMKSAPAPADLLRATSIDMRDGAHDWEIAQCHVRGSGQDLFSTNDSEHDVAIHDCLFENAADDAFEIEGKTDVGRVAIYGNLVENCLTGVAPGQDTKAFTGPLLVYRNIFANLRNPPINRAAGINKWNGGGRFGYEYMMKQNGTTYATRNTHYYQNTMVLLGSAGRGINLIPKHPEDCRIANNILVTVNGPVNRAYDVATSTVVDGNLYWRINSRDPSPLLGDATDVATFAKKSGIEMHGIGRTPKRGTDPRLAALRLKFADSTGQVWRLDPRSERFDPMAFALTATSPARGAAIAIPPVPGLGTLPDSHAGRDLGAIPYGTPPSEYAGFPFVARIDSVAVVRPRSAGRSGGK